MPSAASKNLETFPNPAPERDFHIHLEIPEFTCLSPNIGSYRNEGAFHEAVTNQILDDLVAATQPRFMRLTARFYVRGGIFTSVVAEHRKPGWQPQPVVDLLQFGEQASTRG